LTQDTKALEFPFNEEFNSGFLLQSRSSPSSSKSASLVQGNEGFGQLGSLSRLPHYSLIEFELQ